MPRPAIAVHGGAGAAADRAHEDVRQHGCQRACAAGWHILDRGGSALDAVIASVVTLEDDPVFNAGVGSSLTVTGHVEMDASIMDGATLSAGAVGVLTRVRNPIRLAHAIMADGRHVTMAGAGAELVAAEHGLEMVEPSALVTERQRSRWQAHSGGDPGTVGAVALDRYGHAAAATSTGGLMNKREGRIGDSAVIGAGTYADDGAGAASCTGEGEIIIRLGVARRAIDLLRDGRDPQLVAQRVIHDLGQRLPGDAGIILVDRFGRIGIAHNTASMPTARSDRD